MIFTVFLEDGSKYSYDYEKYDWSLGERYFYVQNAEKTCALLVCPVEEVVKVIVEGDEL